jgi:hypothetical protein
MLNKIFTFVICASFILSVAAIAYSDEISAYKQGWYDGYRKATRDAFVGFSKNIKDYKLLIETVFDYKKILFSGEGNMFRVQTEYERTATDNGIEFKEKIKVIPLTPRDEIVFLEIIKNRFGESFERVSVSSGWWVFSDVSSIAKEDIGMLEFIAEQTGMRPKRFNDILVFSIEGRAAEAHKAQQLLETYNIKTEVSYVEIK